MGRIGLVVALTASIALTSAAGDAYRLTRVPHIGVLYPESHRCARAFRQGLIDLGYVEGRTVAFEYRPGGSFAQHVEQAQELVRRKVDVLVAANGRAAVAAQQVTQTIPIVAFGSDAVETGLVAGLARPGGNITGISMPVQELAGKRLEIIKSIVPTADRIEPTSSSSERRLMDRRAFIATGTGSILAVPLAVSAQQAARSPASGYFYRGVSPDRIEASERIYGSSRGSPRAARLGL